MRSRMCVVSVMRGLSLALALVPALACVRHRPPEVATAPTVLPEGIEPGTPLALLYARSLMVPVHGVRPDQVANSFDAGRGSRQHNALDIPAPRGTPVVAADAGRILRLANSASGGISLYQLDPEQRFVYYYAHLDRFRSGLRAGMEVAQGEVLGYVGTSGNAPPHLPHLHFQVMLYRPGRYWEGEPLNPFGLFVRPGQAR